MFTGYLSMGCNEILSRARAYGYSRTADCPVSWLRLPECGDIASALAERAYDYANIDQAPWYDVDDETTHRFFGAYPTRIDQITDSTRTANLVEGILDGGVVAGLRYAMRTIRCTAVLLARGEDALEAGFSWLDAALRPDECGIHGSSCGEVDATFFAACPRSPEDFLRVSTEWVSQTTNLATNPSFETAAAAAAVRTNLNTNPRLANNITNWSTTAANMTIAANAAGAQIDVTLAATSIPALFPTAIIAVVAGETFSSSMEVTVPAGFPAVTFILRNFSYGDNVILNESGAVTMNAGETRRIVAEGALAVAAASTGVRPVLYVTTPVGARFLARNVITEKSPVARPYFDGTTQPKLRVNLFGNPHSVGTTNPINLWTAVNGSTGLPIIATSPAYTANVVAYPGQIIGGRVRLLSNTGATVTVAARETLNASFGSQPTTQSKVVTLVAGVAQEVTVGGPVLGATSNGWRISLSTAGTDVQVLGTTMEAGTSAPADIFGGSDTAPQGYAYAWEGVANQSPSYLYDTDFTTAWTGTANASTSNLSGLSVPGATAGAGAAVQSSHWAASGTKSLRLTPVAASGTGGTNFATVRSWTAADAGKTFTVYATARITTAFPDPPAVSDRSILVTQTGASTMQGPQAPNTPGEHLVTWTFTLSPALTGGSLRLYSGGGVSDPDVWWDDLLIVEGEYADGYFDGTTPDATDPPRQYDWTGAAHASTSTAQYGVLVESVDQEAYLAHVEKLIRVLHGVVAISGPIVQRKMRRGEVYGYIVEFVLAASTPFVFTLPEELQLDPASPTVVADDPVNLVPYPSAELASGTVEVARNYTLNPSAEANVTGWTLGMDGTVITGSAAALVASTDTHADGAGLQSVKLTWTAVITSAAAGWIAVQQDVVLAHAVIAGERYSVNIWGNSNVESGTAVLGDMEVWAIWRTGSTTTRSDRLGVVPGRSGAFSAKSLVPPVGATSVVAQVRQRVDSFSTGAKVRLYADALAVTVP